MSIKKKTRALLPEEAIMGTTLFCTEDADGFERAYKHSLLIMVVAVALTFVFFLAVIYPGWIPLDWVEVHIAMIIGIAVFVPAFAGITIFILRGRPHSYCKKFRHNKMPE